MSVKDSVLEFLENNKGTALSGEEIAKNIGVSRNSVWKAIKVLKESGYRIDAVTNKGYTLVTNNDILSPQSIEKYLDDKYNVLVYPTVDSTNNEAKKLAVKGSAEGTVVISEEQTAGKGRLGRRFESPKKTGIYMSILLRPKFSAEESLFITTSAAVAVAKSIEKVSGKETQIKWVNDIYIDEKKICGILTEASINFESGGLEYAVVGIGINVKLPEGGFPSEIANIAGAVYDYECGDDVRSRIIASVINTFFELYKKLPQKDYIEEYRKRSLLTGREVEFTAFDKGNSGVVIDIDDEARLLVRLKDGTVHAFSTGEVTLKKSFLKS